MLFRSSLHAGTYLTKTRTAAYLWVKENPRKAGVLLIDQQYRSEYLSLFLPLELEAVDSFAGSLTHQVAAAHRIVGTTLKLLTTFETAGCETQGAMLNNELSQHISAVIAPGAE